MPFEHFDQDSSGFCWPEWTSQRKEHISTSFPHGILDSTTEIMEFLIIIYLFWKRSSGLRSPCCLYACVPAYVSGCERLDAWNNLYETWYVNHGTWTNIKSILYKSLPSACVSLYVLLLGSVSVNTFLRQRIHAGIEKFCWTCNFLCCPCNALTIARQRIIKHVPPAANFWIHHSLCDPCRIKETWNLFPELLAI